MTREEIDFRKKITKFIYWLTALNVITLVAIITLAILIIL